MSLFRNRSLLAATLGHFSVDVYSGMLPLILLALTDPLGLTYSQVGLVAMIFSLTSSISQPFFGWLGDRRHERLLAVIGVAAIATTMGFMRFANQLGQLVLLAPIAGLGSAAFHPQGAVMAANASAERRGSAMSIFMLGGNSGFAIGPLLGAFAFTLVGGYMPETLAMIGLLQAALIYWIMSGQQMHAAKRKAGSSSGARATVSVMVLLGLAMFLRSWVSNSVTTYIPQVVKAQGFSTETAGSVLFSILMPLAIGGLIGGTLSDHIGRRRVLVISTALATPALLGLLHVSGPLSYAFGPMLGIALGASLPVTLVMAQEMIPRGLGMMSGVVLGFTFVAGAIGVSVNGAAADFFGLIQTMNLNALLPLAAATLAFFLPKDQPAEIFEAAFAEASVENRI
jgi:MFS transporter, FSR family, fosmidomycin resistance protein